MYRYDAPWAKSWNLPYGTFEPLAEPVRLTYFDLDRLIETSGLTEKQKQTVVLQMMGYKIPDIAENMLGVDERIARKYFLTAVQKICDQHELEWRNVHSVVRKE